MKYLLIILLSFFGLSGYSQLMQTNGTAGGYQFVGLKSDSLNIIPRGSDTPNIGGTKYGKSTVGAMFYKTTDSTLWIRSANKWNQVTGSGGTSTDSLYYRGGTSVDSFFYTKDGTEYFWYANPSVDRIIYGGIVTWTGTDLDYYVSACYFRKNGIYYLTDDTTVTLPALAAADSSRSDVFIVQTLSDTQAQTTTITGTESANPITPQVNGTTDLYLTHVTLNPGQTTGLTDTLIVYDNLSGGEFEYRGSTGVTTNFSNTTNVYRVPYSANVSAINNNDVIGFGTETQRNALNYSGLSFFIKLKTVMPNNNGMLVSLWNNGVQVSNEVGIPFNRTNLTYQGFSVPMESFGVTNAYFDSVRFRYSGGGAGISGMYFDFIYFQANLKPGGSGAGGNNKWVSQGTGIIIDSTTTPTVYNISADTTLLATQNYVDSSINVSGGIQSVVAGYGIDVDNTDPVNPIVSVLDTVKNFIFEAPIQANEYGDTVYVYLDSTGNGNYSIAHHSFGYYLGVFLTSAQAANTYITYDSAQGKYMDTSYVSNDTIYGVKNGAPFFIATTGGSGSVEYVISGLGTRVDSSGRAYTVNVDTASTVILSRQRAAATYVPLIRTISTGWGLSGGGDFSTNRTHIVDSFLVASRARVDKVADSLGVIIATKQSQLNGTGYVKMSGTTPSYQSNTQLTSDVNTFTQTLSGAVPAPVTLNGYFLKDDGTWAAAGSSLTGVQGDIIYFSGLNTVANLAKNTTATRYLSNTGTSNNPAWAQIDLTNGVTGTLPVANGGTNNTTFTAYSPIYAGTTSTGAFQSSTLGASGTVLTSTGTSSLPTWQAQAVGLTTMAAIGATPNANGASISGNTLTLQPANGSFGGVVTTAAQTFAGAKTFSSTPTFSTMTAGSVMFSGTAGILSNSSNLFWDNTNGRLGIGTNAPAGKLDVVGDIRIGTSLPLQGLNINSTHYSFGDYMVIDPISASTPIGIAYRPNGNYNNFQNSFELQLAASNTSNIKALQIVGNTAKNRVFFGTTNTGTGLSSALTIALGAGVSTGSGWNFAVPSVMIKTGAPDYALSVVSNGVIVGDSTDLVASSIFEIKSTTKGALLPRMTTTQRDAISSPATGLQIYNTTLNCINTYNGVNWAGDVIVSSAATLTLKQGNDYIFTGTTTTWTLPAISATVIGRDNGVKIKNRGSGAITLNTATGSTLYTTSAVSTITINAGAACELLPDGTYNLVQYNL